jgi:hypothetical protein
MSKSIYIVSCGCGGTTVTPPPKHRDYVPVVKCNLCHRRIDASKGSFRQKAVTVKPRHEPDLLEV